MIAGTTRKVEREAVNVERRPIPGASLLTLSPALPK